jgi:hypothetical protein
MAVDYAFDGMKCEEKEKALASSSNLNFERFDCQEILVHYWLSVFDLHFAEAIR